MSIIAILVTLLIIGVVIYIVMQVPLPAFIRNIMYAVICLLVVLWLLQEFGIYNSGLKLH